MTDLSLHYSKRKNSAPLSALSRDAKASVSLAAVWKIVPKTSPLNKSLLGATVLLASCNIGVSASRLQAAESAAPVDGTVSQAEVSSVGAEVCPKGVQAAKSGLLDDLEDGNTQLDAGDDRDGYWWHAMDPAGSTMDQANDFAPSPGGPEGSTQAIHVSGTTATGDAAWGAQVGFNMSSAGLYDATRFVGVRFKARVGANSTKRVRFKVGDVNTHQDAGVCEACWNHFGKDLTLSEDWKEYTLFFKELTQQAGWGKPRPPEVSVKQLYSMDVSIDKGQTYDVWLDELEFVECTP